MVFDPWHVSWCEACEWNLDPSGSAMEGHRGRRRAQRRADRRGRVLHSDVIDAPLPSGQARGVRIVSYALATLVHLPAVALVGYATLVLITGGVRLGALLVALLAGALAYALRPRFGRLPKRAVTLQRGEAPVLFGLLDEIAKAGAARPVRWVAVDMAFNASTADVGIRRERLVTIGLPLWCILAPQERVALLAHELAHDTNGDVAHATMISSSLSLIATWHDVLRPGPRIVVSRSVALADSLARLLLTGAAAAVCALYRLQLSLARRSSPRAEYLADASAVRIASRVAVRASLGKLLLSDSCKFALDRARLRGEADVWAAVHRDMEAIPERERERLRRIARRRGHRVDETHPPTALRIDALSGTGPDDAPAVVLDAARAATIDAEVINRSPRESSGRRRRRRAA